LMESCETFFFFLFLFLVLGFELRAYTLRHSTSSFFVKGCFLIESQEQFAKASFKP
jgi:hypothetical protein